MVDSASRPFRYLTGDDQSPFQYLTGDDQSPFQYLTGDDQSQHGRPLHGKAVQNEASQSAVVHARTTPDERPKDVICPKCTEIPGSESSLKVRAWRSLNVYLGEYFWDVCRLLDVFQNTDVQTALAETTCLYPLDVIGPTLTGR